MFGTNHSMEQLNITNHKKHSHSLRKRERPMSSANSVAKHLQLTTSNDEWKYFSIIKVSKNKLTNNELQHKYK